MSVATCMLNKLKSFSFVAQLERWRRSPVPQAFLQPHAGSLPSHARRVRNVKTCNKILESLGTLGKQKQSIYRVRCTLQKTTCLRKPLAASRKRQTHPCLARNSCFSQPVCSRSPHRPNRPASRYTTKTPGTRAACALTHPCCRKTRRDTTERASAMD